MPTNPFFNFYNSKQEQNLVEDLINEALGIYSFEAYYVPRDSDVQPDLLYGENPLKSFSNAYPIHLHLANSQDPGMNNDFFSKFGLEMKNNLKVILSRRVFERMVKNNILDRPIEGDLIYIPWLSGTGELYEIKYTNDTVDFFVLGRKNPYYWNLELEMFKYSHEEIETGVPEINIVSEQHAYSILFEMGNPFTSSAENYIIGELVQQEHYPFYKINDKGLSEEVKVDVIDNQILIADSKGIVSTISLDYKEDLEIYLENGTKATMDILKVAQATVVDWNRSTQTLRLNLIQGEFLLDEYVSGVNSGASYKIIKYNPIDIPTIRDSTDNYNLQDESSNYIDSSVSNPFGLL